MACCFGETGGQGEVVEFAFVAPGFDCGVAGVEAVGEVLAVGAMLFMLSVLSWGLGWGEESY